MMKKKGVVPRPGDDPRERLCAGGCEGLYPSDSPHCLGRDGHTVLGPSGGDRTHTPYGTGF